MLLGWRGRRDSLRNAGVDDLEYPRDCTSAAFKDRHSSL